MTETARQCARARTLAKAGGRMPVLLDVDLEAFAMLQLEVLTRHRSEGGDVAEMIAARAHWKAPRQVNIMVDGVWVSFVGVPPPS